MMECWWRDRRVYRAAALAAERCSAVFRNGVRPSTSLQDGGSDVNVEV